MTIRLLCAVLAAVSLAGCGGGEEAAVPAENAVEATEANVVELGGVRYRVFLFRELNPRIEPDDAFYDGPPAGDGAGLYAAFLQACNPTDEPVEETAQVTLEDAFGERFLPLPEGTDEDFGYSPGPLTAGTCRPEEGSVAERTFSGGAVVFEVPFDSVAERPLVLELEDGEERRRVQLDV